MGAARRDTTVTILETGAHGHSIKVLIGDDQASLFQEVWGETDQQLAGWA